MCVLQSEKQQYSSVFYEHEVFSNKFVMLQRASSQASARNCYSTSGINLRCIKGHFVYLSKAVHQRIHCRHVPIKMLTMLSRGLHVHVLISPSFGLVYIGLSRLSSSYCAQCTP